MQVFGLYFMQSYIGILYHAILHRNFMTLRQVIIQRLIISEVVKLLFMVFSKLGEGGKMGGLDNASIQKPYLIHFFDIIISNQCGH